MRNHLPVRNLEHLDPQRKELAQYVWQCQNQALNHVTQLQKAIGDVNTSNTRRQALQQSGGRNLVSRIRRGLARYSHELFAPAEEHEAERAQAILDKPLSQVDLNPRNAFFDPMAHSGGHEITIAGDELESLLANVTKKLNQYRQAKKEQWYRIYKGSDMILSGDHTIADLPIVLGKILEVIDPQND